MKNNFVLVYLDTSNKNIALKLLKSKGINLWNVCLGPALWMDEFWVLTEASVAGEVLKGSGGGGP